MQRYDAAVEEYRAAVALQPGYVTAWNNLGNALEQTKDIEGAFDAYGEALAYAPDNEVARQRYDALKGRIDRLQLK